MWFCSKQYLCRPFNIYLFPRAGANGKFDKRYSFKNGAFEFLSRNHFDFNKWIYGGLYLFLPSFLPLLIYCFSSTGVTYLNKEDEEAYVKKVKATANPETPTKTIELDEVAQKYIAGVLYAPVFSGLALLSRQTLPP